MKTKAFACVFVLIIIAITVILILQNSIISEKISLQLSYVFSTPLTGVIDTEKKYVGVVYTSCGRWNVLSQSIKSFESFNTYPFISKKYVIDDSNDTVGFERMSSIYSNIGWLFIHSGIQRKYWSLHRQILISKMGFDLFKNDTTVEYVMGIEDDWTFYQKGFIEDSLAILKSDTTKYTDYVQRKYKISTVNLRNLQMIWPIHSMYEYCGGWASNRLFMKLFVSDSYGYNNKKVKYLIHKWPQDNNCYGHWQLGPTLKSKSDFYKIYANNTHFVSERWLSCAFRDNNYTMAVIPHGYVGHIGAGLSIKRRLRAYTPFNETNCKYINTTNNRTIEYIDLIEGAGFVTSITDPKTKLIDYGIRYEHQVPMVIWLIWMNGNKTTFTAHRREGYQSIITQSNITTILITPDNLNEWVLRDYPLHPSFKYLTKVHQSDYLRVYLMHFYGGGYIDIKPLKNDSWNKYYDIFKNDSIWLIGPAERSIWDIAAKNDTIRRAYNELITVAQWISRAKTILTSKIYNAQQKVLDLYRFELKKSFDKWPNKPPICCHSRVIEKYIYPICWNCLLGQIFQNYSYQYRQHIDVTQERYDDTKEYA